MISGSTEKNMLNGKIASSTRNKPVGQSFNNFELPKLGNLQESPKSN